MTLRLITLSLLILYPIAWFAPLMRAGLLPIFGLREICVITGLQSLWHSDVFLALVPLNIDGRVGEVELAPGSETASSVHVELAFLVQATHREHLRARHSHQLLVG